jgi:hypothetical protein
MLLCRRLNGGHSPWSERLEVSWRRKKIKRVVELRSIDGL